MQAVSLEPAAFDIRPRDPRLTDCLKNYPPSLFSERLYQSVELMERYSIQLAFDLLRRLNVVDQLGQWRSPSELCRILSFQSGFTSSLRWILERLVETGCIEVRGGADARYYRLRSLPGPTELTLLRAAALNIDPANAATLDLLDHAASLYPGVARGERSGDQSLFGPQGIPLWLNYFHNDNLTYAVNNLVTAAVAADRVSTRPALQILEVGAGAGSGTEALLRWFEKQGILPRIGRYLVTEPNAFFRRRAQRELVKQYPNVSLEWGELDLNLPWQSQGVRPGEFDLVYAVNVLHISKDLLFSLNEARAALTGDGWLVIGECLRPYLNQPIYPELMFQILESFSDVSTDQDIRPNPGFLTADQWRRTFSHAGFTQIEVAPDVDNIREIYAHFFTGAVCGQNPAIPDAAS